MQQIYNETIRAIVDELYETNVTALLPTNPEQLLALQNMMDFPYAFGAIDGCHIRLNCPIGETSRKDYFNFKNFYSIILLAIVDGRGRFLWACSGMPGNCHDSTLLQSTDLWTSGRLRAICELTTQQIGGVTVPGMILADNAFPFRSYIMKRFSQANRNREQRTFNRKLASDRVIVENTFGWLKMRFRELFRGSESQPENLKYASLAAVTLHNILHAREGAQLDVPDQDDLVFLEDQVMPENHQLAAQVRNVILPLVL